jgi:hypothetical protein
MKKLYSKPPLILLLGRDDWQKDINLNYMLVHYIQKKESILLGKTQLEDQFGGSDTC